MSQSSNKLLDYCPGTLVLLTMLYRGLHYARQKVRSPKGIGAPLLNDAIG